MIKCGVYATPVGADPQLPVEWEIVRYRGEEPVGGVVGVPAAGDLRGVGPGNHGI